VAASALGVTIPRRLITSRDTDFAGDKVGFFITGESSINSVDVSRIETSMSSMLLLVEENNMR